MCSRQPFWFPAPHSASSSQPIQVTPRVYYVQGRPGVASAENEGFNSNAGFVVTDEGVVVDRCARDADARARAGRAPSARSRRKPIKRVIVTHYHADHFYGLQALKEAGADIWAHRAALEYLDSGEAQRRLEQRSRDLFPWVDDKTALVRADRWLDEDDGFHAGRCALRGPATWGRPIRPRTSIVVVPSRRRDLQRRHPVRRDASPSWARPTASGGCERIDKLLALKPALMITGHGAVSRDPGEDLALTRDYLIVPARKSWARRSRSCAIRRGLRAGGLEPLRETACVRGGQPHQRVRDLPADGEGSAQEVSSGSPTGRNDCAPMSGMLWPAPGRAPTLRARQRRTHVTARASPAGARGRRRHRRASQHLESRERPRRHDLLLLAPGDASSRRQGEPGDGRRSRSIRSKASMPPKKPARARDARKLHEAFVEISRSARADAGSKGSIAAKSPLGRGQHLEPQ